MTLDELKEKRQAWVESSRKNKFEAGIKKLLSQLYPDNAHFIYELLQNSEDTEASIVRFFLNEDGLVFEHNGKKLFSLADIESITSIGESTKREDPTSIGKFGVGFKAVFAYTNTPEIHSGNFSFQIHDLVVPDSLVAKKDLSQGMGTHFYFPFDNPAKHPLQAIEEIERGLIDLRDNTLLFLGHIRRIEYSTSSGLSGFLERVDSEGGQIKIISQHPGQEKIESNWLRFHKDVEVLTENNNPIKCRVAIAYSLVENITNKKSDEWKIVPLERGEVSIYFPAENATSNLRFHIHAPFASTVARDSVRDVIENKLLLIHISDLIVESLELIKQMDMLGVSFLAVMPNRMDNLIPFYSPIRDAVIKAFKELSLIPTKSGSHAPGNMLYRGPTKIMGIITDDDLSFLTNNSLPLWAMNTSQKSAREEYFLESINIDEWSWEKLIAAFRWGGCRGADSIESWISTKKDDWLMRLYGLMGEACETYNCYPHGLESLKIVRVISEKNERHVSGDQAYFYLDEFSKRPKNIPFIKPDVYSTGGSDSTKKYAEAFLVNLGVKNYDEKAIIEMRLKRYLTPIREVDSQHFSDIEDFCKFSQKFPKEREIFQNYQFLIGVPQDESALHWKGPSDLCIDTPFIKTGLVDFIGIHRKFKVWGRYFSELSEGTLPLFIEFLKVVGVMYELKVERASTYQNPMSSYLHNQNGRRTNNEINRDYSIGDLKKYLRTNSVSASLLIWNAFIKADAMAGRAEYRPNSDHSIRVADSQLIHYLKHAAWIPSKKNVFLKPQDATRDDLYDEFVYNNQNGLLAVIGFGSQEEQRDKEYQAKDLVVKDLGFKSLDEAARMVKVLKSGMSIDQIESLINKSQPVDFPEEVVPNPDLRRSRVLENAGHAVDKAKMKLERSMDPSTNLETAEAKAFLRAKYVNSDGKMVCQCCEQEMLFKVNSLYYFEAIQFLRSIKRHYPANRIALCPNCAAMYQYARETTDQELQSRINDIDITNQNSPLIISVVLAGRAMTIRFVATHALDLKTVLTMALK